VSAGARLQVKPIACDGRGYCAEILPEMITLDDWGFPVIRDASVPTALHAEAPEAVRVCPRLALRLDPPDRKPAAPPTPLSRPAVSAIRPGGQRAGRHWPVGPSPLLARAGQRCHGDDTALGGNGMNSLGAPRHGRVYRRLAADAATLRLSPEPAAATAPVTEADLAGLPTAAQRYLRFMDVIGRPPDWSFLAHFTGRFRLRPRLPWMRCEAWQYSTCPAATRLYHMRMYAAGVLPMTGRYAYHCGHGRMHGKLGGLLPVADGSGPEYDLSELVTYLNDAVLLAPSMLVSLPVTWAHVSDSAFDLTLTDAGHQVTARVFVDGRGAPTDFSTDDRWCARPEGLVRTRWSTPVQGWMKVNGRWQPGRGSAVWHLPDGPFCYAEFGFAPGAVLHNVPPPELSLRPPARTWAGLAAVPRDLRNWGASHREQASQLPGDELVAEPAGVTTLAVTIDAPSAKAWRWLVQIGQDRGGLYSYDWLENFFGLHMHSAGEIRDEWQSLVPGDQVRLVPRGWLGLRDGLALPVAQVDPGRAIVLREQPPQQPWDAVWSFHVVPLGAGRCRLISRSRSARAHGAGRLATPLMEPVTLMMTRKMLLGIKQRAEQHTESATASGSRS
jgi:ferredoxin